MTLSNNHRLDRWEEQTRNICCLESLQNLTWIFFNFFLKLFGHCSDTWRKLKKKLNWQLMVDNRRRSGLKGLSSLSLSLCPCCTSDGHWQLGDQCWLKHLAVFEPALLWAVSGGGGGWSCEVNAPWWYVETVLCFLFNLPTGHSRQVEQTKNDETIIKRFYFYIGNCHCKFCSLI